MIIILIYYFMILWTQIKQQLPILWISVSLIIYIIVIYYITSNVTFPSSHFWRHSLLVWFVLLQRGDEKEINQSGHAMATNFIIKIFATYQTIAIFTIFWENYQEAYHAYNLWIVFTLTLSTYFLMPEYPNISSENIASASIITEWSVGKPLSKSEIKSSGT